MPAETIIALVNINDADALKAVVDETGVSDSSKADRIASATRRVMTEKMDEDPAFYKQFSELLEDTIRDYRLKRLSELEYLKSVIELATKVARKERDQEVPAAVQGDEDGQAFYGLLYSSLTGAGGSPLDTDQTAGIALAVIEIVKQHHIVDVWANDVAQNNMRNAIDDYFFDVVRDEMGIKLPVETLDDLEAQIMSLARARFPG